MCDINIAILSFMLASVMTKAVDGKDEIWRVISLSSWTCIESFSFLFTKLKEKQSEKISVKWKPEVNSRLRGENDGKMP